MSRIAPFGVLLALLIALPACTTGNQSNSSLAPTPAKKKSRRRMHIGKGHGALSVTTSSPQERHPTLPLPKQTVRMVGITPSESAPLPSKFDDEGLAILAVVGGAGSYSLPPPMHRVSR